MKISIIIPAYNEEKRIGKKLEKCSEFFSKLKKEKKVNYEIIVVINNTRDKTEDVVKSAIAQDKNIKYLNLKTGGKGFAIIQGFKDALKRDSDLIGFVDADMATSPEQFWRLAENLDGFDGAIADRYLQDSKINSPHPFRRVVVSRVFNILVRALFFFPYQDTQCGAKLFKREVIESVLNDLTLTQWAFDICILYSCKKRGFKIKSVPTVWYEIAGGSLNVLRSSIQMFFAVFQFRVINSPFSRLLKVIKPISSPLYKIVR